MCIQTATLGSGIAIGETTTLGEGIITGGDYMPSPDPLAAFIAAQVFADKIRDQGIDPANVSHVVLKKDGLDGVYVTTEDLAAPRPNGGERGFDDLTYTRVL